MLDLQFKINVLIELLLINNLPVDLAIEVSSKLFFIKLMRTCLQGVYPDKDALAHPTNFLNQERSSPGEHSGESIGG